VLAATEGAARSIVRFVQPVRLGIYRQWRLPAVCFSGARKVRMSGSNSANLATCSDGDTALATDHLLGDNTVRAGIVPVPQSVAARDANSDYRKLVAALASRAVRIGSRDAEGAAQETLRRSLANPVSRAAVEYYLRERAADLHDAPAWSLEQLFGWLYAVLRLVVREESARVSVRREVLAIDVAALDVRDPSPDQLDRLLDAELHTIVR
jgi:hypothetical protein